MRKLLSLKFALVIMLVFTGQSIAMPFLDCCESNDVRDSETHEMSMADMDSSHDLNTSGKHHSSMAGHNEDAFCNHQCDVCPGTILVTALTAYSPQMMHSPLNVLYDFTLVASTTDSPFRPPIFA
ncbi:MAG: hypothetical protein CMP91_05830 [Gammaproteobacteria bacterium]|nr:hypothetical protein [Gammaproteobacteria bacterium]MAY02872.1 hypothetical protein [Gammaproteobacteria bacterium]|tara:strand:- start:60297 stop:60671 length:375 start_codon:yes stop_codon:yes gene_type:complete